MLIPSLFLLQLEKQRDQAQRAWELVDTTLPEVRLPLDISFSLPADSSPSPPPPPKELPRLYEARVQFMEPTMLALLQAEVKFLSGLAATMETMFEADQVAKTDEEYGKEIEMHFQSLSRLSITSTT